MAILVTGGGGYIGSQMAHELLDAGERVVVLDDLSTGFRWAVPENAHFAAGDCGDQAFLTRLFREHGVEAIIHFAAFIVVPDSVRDPLLSQQYRQFPRADRISDRMRHPPFHLFLDCGGLWQSGSDSG